MSKPKPPNPAKLVIGLFMQNKELFRDAFCELTRAFGDADMISPWFSFDYTSYYEREMGGPLFRRMGSFSGLIEQDDLSIIKLRTNSIEDAFSSHGNRQVNIDPGYLLPERFVLATGKNFPHRISIGNQIYADLTLIYQKGGFVSLPWTYPDYQDPGIRDFLTGVRNRYLFAMKQEQENRKMRS